MTKGSVLDINWDDEEVEGISTGMEEVIEAVATEVEVVETVVKETPETQKKKEETVNSNKEETVDWDKEEEEEKVVEKKEIKDSKDAGKDTVVEVEDEEGALDQSIAYLQKRGFVDIELEEGVTWEDLDEEDKLEILEEGFENAMDKKIEELTEKMTPVAKNLLKVAAKGGDVMEYLAGLAESAEEQIPEDLDLKEVDNQKYIASIKLARDGYDEEDIKEFIDTLENSNKLKSFSEKEFSKIVKEQRLAEVEKEKEIANIAKVRRDKEYQYKKDVEAHLKDKGSVHGLKVSTKEINEIPDYISKTTVDAGNGRKITPFYKDLFEGLKNHDNIVLLAKIVKNGWNLDSIVSDLEDKTAKGFRREIQRQNGQQVVIKKKKNQPARSLAEYL
jgi:hypothetical protein